MLTAVTLRAMRSSLLVFLALLEPIVRATLSLTMVLGIIAAIVFELSAVGPRFPFAEMIVLSLGCGVGLFAYYGLLYLLKR